MGALTHQMWLPQVPKSSISNQLSTLTMFTSTSQDNNYLCIRTVT